MATPKRKRLSLVEKYKAITELESGTKPSKVAEKYGVPRNTILLQNCTLFEEEQVASHLRTHLEKFSMLYEKTLESRKQQSKIDNFFTRL